MEQNLEPIDIYLGSAILTMEQPQLTGDEQTQPLTMEQPQLTGDEQTQPLTMEAFLIDIEKKAYHMAAFATNSHHDALDLLQESMIKLVEKYQHLPSTQWKPLFYKILKNKIYDWQRHQKVKNLVFFWKQPTEEQQEWPEMGIYGSSVGTPEQDITKKQQQQAVISQLKELSEKQRQCFLLRCWEGLSVAETAEIMECSQGSVKTHYSRATAKLKLILEAGYEFTL